MWRGSRSLSGLPVELAVVRAGGVEQQGVPGGCGVEDDEPVLGSGDGSGAGAEDSDLLGARRREVLLEDGAGTGVEVAAGCGQDLGGVGGGLRDGVDAGDLYPGCVTTEDAGDVGSGVGGGELHLVPAGDQRDRDGAGDGGLADAALAHGHHQAVSLSRDAVDDVTEPGGLGCLRQRDVSGLCAAAIGGGELPQTGDPQRAAHEQGHGGTGELGQPDGHRGERVFALCLQSRSKGVLRTGGGGEDAVDDEPLGADAQATQLGAGPLGLGQCREVGTGDEQQGGSGGIGQRGHGGGVTPLLGPQPRQRTEAGGAGAVTHERGPRRG
ncbi:hypothetical protein BH24ACT12_BH24ACT12_08680 [soil metagenome]